MDHLGVQVESEAELTALREQVAARRSPPSINPTRSAVMRAPISTGQLIRKELPGKLSIPSKQFRFTAKQNARRQALAAPPRRPWIRD